ncbi:MAG: hypothetical protein ACETWQ_03295 [Phycisphaerae bacterium]
MDQKKPIKSYRVGGIQASIWKNEKERDGNTVLQYSVRIQKQYRNDEGDYQNTDFRTTVVWKWYEWTQELYSDAVGLTIGGPCFLKAFSHYFCTRSVDQFYVPRQEQLLRRHPVTWIREKMLVDRAKKLGFNDLANHVDSMWQETANTLGISEDYEGTWAEEFFVPLGKTIDDMLEESEPLQFNGRDIDPKDGCQNPIQLLNSAWDKFEEDPFSYRFWEKNAIENYLRSL